MTDNFPLSTPDRATSEASELKTVDLTEDHQFTTKCFIMYSFEGAYRTKPKQSLGGASKKVLQVFYRNQSVLFFCVILDLSPTGNYMHSHSSSRFQSGSF